MENSNVTITKSLALKLVEESPYHVDCPQAKSIDDEAVEVLSNYRGDCLSLDNLSEVSDKNLKALIRINLRELSLGLEKLSDRQTEIIELYHGEKLNLDALSEISVEAVDSLSRLQLTELSLTGLQCIGESLAESLASVSRKMRLLLPGSPQITKSALQTLFKEGSNEWSDQRIELCGTISLPDYECVFTDSILNERWANIWKETPSRRRSNSFDCSVVTPAGAKIVARNSSLDFWNLQELSESVAAILAKAKGQLRIGIKSLTVDVARCLALRKEDTHAGFGLAVILASLDEAVAAELAASAGHLTISVNSGISDAVIGILSRHPMLSLWDLTGLSDAAAESLSKHRGELELNFKVSENPITLSDAVRKSLMKHRGTINHMTPKEWIEWIDGQIEWG